MWRVVPPSPRAWRLAVSQYGGRPWAIIVSTRVEVYRAKARRGEVLKVTGIDDVYEAPEKPDVVIDTSQSGAEDCALKCLQIMLIGKCRACKMQV